jgi:hypothetical protein
VRAVDWGGERVRRELRGRGSVGSASGGHVTRPRACVASIGGQEVTRVREDRTTGAPLRGGRWRWAVAARHGEGCGPGWRRGAARSGRAAFGRVRRGRRRWARPARQGEGGGAGWAAGWLCVGCSVCSGPRGPPGRARCAGGVGAGWRVALAEVLASVRVEAPTPRAWCAKGGRSRARLAASGTAGLGAAVLRGRAGRWGGWFDGRGGRCSGAGDADCQVMTGKKWVAVVAPRRGVPRTNHRTSTRLATNTHTEAKEVAPVDRAPVAAERRAQPPGEDSPGPPTHYAGGRAFGVVPQVDVVS